MKRGLPPSIVAAIDRSSILGIRAGSRSGHRFTGVWPIVVDGRVFVRSWTLKAGGWYRTLAEEPSATIQVGSRRVRVTAARATGERLLDAIERAYDEKYPTPGARKFVRGFRAKRRRAATIEFIAPRAGTRKR